MPFLGPIAGFLASKLGAWVVAGVALAAIAGFAWYVWTDREALQLETARLERALADQAAAHAAAVEGLETQLGLERLRGERERAAATRRAAEASALAARLEDLAALEAADTGGDDACPLHPALVWALGRLREPAAP